MCKMLRHPTCCGSGDGYKTSVPVQHSTHHSLNLTSVIQLGLIAKSIGTDRSVFPLPSDHLPSLFPSDSASAMQKPPLLPWRMAATELLFLQQNGKQPTMNQRTTAAARQGNLGFAISRWKRGGNAQARLSPRSFGGYCGRSRIKGRRRRNQW